MKELIFFLILVLLPNISFSSSSQERELQEQEKQLRIIQECKQKISSSSELTSSNKRMLELKLCPFYEASIYSDIFIYPNLLSDEHVNSNLLSEEYVRAEYNRWKDSRELEKFHELINLIGPIKANCIRQSQKYQWRCIEHFEVNLQNYLKKCEELQERGLSLKNLELLKILLWKLRFIEPYKDVRDRIANIEMEMKPIEEAEIKRKTAITQREEEMRPKILAEQEVERQKELKKAEEEKEKKLLAEQEAERQKQLREAEEEKEKKLLAEQYVEQQKRLRAKREKYGLRSEVFGQQLTANPFKYEEQVVILSMISFERMLDRNTGSFDDLAGHQLVVSSLPSNLFTMHGQMAQIIVRVKGTTSAKNAFGATFDVPLVEYIDLYQ